MKKIKSRIIAMFTIAMMICAMLPTNVLAATCTATINFKIIPVYLDSSKNLGYDVDYNAAIEDTFPCQYTSTHSTNANHSIQIKNWYPDTCGVSVRSGYTWAGWIKYTQYLSKTNVQNPPFSTFYSWSTATTDVSGTGTHYIYLVYHPNTPASVNYTLTYNANGGNGAPAAVTQSSTTGSSVFTILNTVPTRDGYTFKGWADSANATTATYQGGDTITLTGNKTIYAVWEKNAPVSKDYTLIYDPNGGEGGPGSETKASDTGSATFTVSSDEPTREGYTFKGWADSADAAAPNYLAGDELTITGSVLTKTIYAVWEQNQEPDPDPDPTPEPDPDEKDSEPGMKKEVSEESVKPGDTVAFTLKSNVPDYLGDYLNPVDPDEPSAQADGDVVRGAYKLTLHDKMDSAFTFDPTSLVVKVNGKTINAESGLYTLTQDPDDDCTFHVTMDLVKIYEDGNYFTLEEIESCPEIVVTYNATLSEDAKAGTYKNTAWTGYEGKESEKPEVEVKVYGINVFKYDQSDNKGLAGAEFELKDSDGNLVATLTSGEDGYVTYEGLKAGTYTLTEITAPEGYVKSDKPLTITLPDDADETTLIAAVKFANSLVPHTGGNGTTMFTIIGLLIICAAAAVFVASRRKNGQKS